MRKSSNDSIPEIVIEKLWELMDFQPFHDSAIKMLMEIHRLAPDLITNYLAHIIQSSSYEEKEKSFKRFSAFWKLTTNQGDSPDNPLNQINKIGMFMMIEFLDDENPLLRHASKNWMIESITFFEKIMDPLLEDMISCNQFYVSEGGQYFFTEVYDTEKVFSKFKKLKNILVTITELFSHFLVTKKLEPKIRENLDNLIEYDLLHPERTEATYFDLLIVICIRYIQGQALESLSPVFAKSNSKVSSVACEFFDLLVTNIPQKSIEIAKYVCKPLLDVQRHAVSNNNFVIQVQLLSLLKFIIFGKNALNNFERRGELLGILNSPMLMPKIIQGLHSRSPYVLIQYVNFIDHALPTLAEVLPTDSLEKLIDQILKTYRSLITKYSNGINAEEEDATKIVIHTDHGAPDKDNAEITAKDTGNLFYATGMQMQSNTMELISILIGGIYFIYNFFLKIEEAEELAKMGLDQEDKRYIKLITFGVLGGSRRGEIDDPKFYDIAKSIVLSLKQTLTVFISCWTSAEHYDKHFQVHNLGMKVFSFDEFQLYNIVEDSSENTHTRNVKTLIVRIVQNFYIKFKDITMDTFFEVWHDEVKINEYPPEQARLTRAGKFVDHPANPAPNLVQTQHPDARVHQVPIPESANGANHCLLSRRPEEDQEQHAGVQSRYRRPRGNHPLLPLRLHLLRQLLLHRRHREEKGLPERYLGGCARFLVSIQEPAAP